MELRVGDRRVLVDCGLFQGSRTLETLNRERSAFDAGRLDGVILTHALADARYRPEASASWPCNSSTAWWAAST